MGLSSSLCHLPSSPAAPASWSPPPISGAGLPVNWVSFIVCRGSHRNARVLPLLPVWGTQHVALTLESSKSMTPLAQDLGSGPHTLCSCARTPSHPQPTLHQGATLVDQSFPLLTCPQEAHPKFPDWFSHQVHSGLADYMCVAGFACQTTGSRGP